MVNNIVYTEFTNCRQNIEIMGSKVISFRLDDDKLALLKQHQVAGESESQTAMRLLLGVLGVDSGKSSIQSVDIVDSVRNEIKQSIADGDIGEKIDKTYKAAIGQFNGLLEEVQELQKQVRELQSYLPIEQSTIENIRTTLKRQNITVATEQIRQAFRAAGWDGNNFSEIKDAVIKILGGGKK